MASPSLPSSMGDGVQRHCNGKSADSDDEAQTGNAAHFCPILGKFVVPTYLIISTFDDMDWQEILMVSYKASYPDGQTVTLAGHENHHRRRE